MAITLDVKYRGIGIRNSYVSVVPNSVTLSKTEMSFSVTYRSYKDEEPFSAQNFSAPYDIDGVNPFVQAYEYLKLQPEFFGSVDC